MRISTDPTDTHYDKDAQKYNVFLNGVKVEKCVTADTWLRYVVVYELAATDSLGRLIPMKYLANLARKKVKGDVVIKKCSKF